MKRILLIILALISLSYSPHTQTKNNIPAKCVYIRVFKYEKELEVWTRNLDGKEYTLYKTYPICRLSGVLGPKRGEGDLQVPEGFYYINDFNPNSKYHLSLGISYPNQSDKTLSPYPNLGGSIYIHGNCVSVGCVAVGDKAIEEIYSLCKNAYNDNIPVHIFPIRFNSLNAMGTLQSKIKDENVMSLEENIKEGYDYFEEYKYPPQVLFKVNGYYVFL